MTNEQTNILDVVCWLYNSPQAWFLSGFFLYFSFLFGSHLLPLFLRSPGEEYEYDRGSYFLSEQKLSGASIIFLLMTIGFWIIHRKDAEWPKSSFVIGLFLCLIIFGVVMGLVYAYRHENKRDVVRKKAAAMGPSFLVKEARRRKRNGQIVLSILGLFFVAIGYNILYTTTTIESVPIYYFVIFSILVSIIHASYSHYRRLRSKIFIFLLEIIAPIIIIVLLEQKITLGWHTLFGFLCISIGCAFFFDFLVLLTRWLEWKKIDREFA